MSVCACSHPKAISDTSEWSYKPQATELHRQMSCLTTLGVEMQAVELDAQRHQHTRSNLNGL